MKFIIFLIIYTSTYQFVIAQDLISNTPSGGGEYVHPQNGPCVSPEQRIEIWNSLRQNKANLKHKIDQLRSQNTSVKFEWPLRQAAGFNYNKYYGISNYVDHNSSSPNLVLDYNCGNRTYDLANGYNHSGTDIFLWPFHWKMYQNNQVEVIAAADGFILNKIDGNTDTNCDYSNPNWNAVFVQHVNGSVTWYGHLKNGSLTSKGIGANVTQGEFLGYVASSGASSGPHLHFEVYDSLNNLVDPYAGMCNSMNTTSFWNNQPSYYEPSINTIMTHHTAPQFNTCPIPAVINDTNCFAPNSTITFASYFSDHQIGQIAKHEVLRPNGTALYTWNLNPSQNYNSSYWYWTRFISNTQPYGQWTYRVILQGDTVQHNFTITPNCAPLTSTKDLSTIDKLKIYPVPASKIISIEALVDFSLIKQLKIINSLGHTIENYTSLNGSGNTITLDISSLNNGLYFIDIQTKNRRYFSKFIVSKE